MPMPKKTDPCAHPNCEHNRYGHAKKGQLWIEACPNCWSNATDIKGNIIREEDMYRESDHDFVESE